MYRGGDSTGSTSYWMAYAFPGAWLVAAGPPGDFPKWLSILFYVFGTVLLLVGLVQGIRQKRQSRHNARND